MRYGANVPLALCAVVKEVLFEQHGDEPNNWVICSMLADGWRQAKGADRVAHLGHFISEKPDTIAFAEWKRPAVNIATPSTPCKPSMHRTRAAEPPIDAGKHHR